RDATRGAAPPGGFLPATADAVCPVAAQDRLRALADASPPSRGGGPTRRRSRDRFAGSLLVNVATVPLAARLDTEPAPGPARAGPARPAASRPAPGHRSRDPAHAHGRGPVVRRNYRHPGDRGNRCSQAPWPGLAPAAQATDRQRPDGVAAMNE